MKKFEVWYSDPNITGPIFMNVVKAKYPLNAARKLARLGYAPIRIKKLLFGK